MLWSIALFLLTMGVGYLVALRAAEEVGLLKHLGNAVAGLMIIGSLLGMAWIGYICFSGCGKMGSMCPFQKQAPSVQQS